MILFVNQDQFRLPGPGFSIWILEGGGLNFEVEGFYDATRLMVPQIMVQFG